MRIVYQDVAGLDVHTHRPTLASGQGHGQKVVVAAIRVVGPDQVWHEAHRTFGTMTADWLALSDGMLGGPACGQGKHRRVVETRLQYVGG